MRWFFILSLFMHAAFFTMPLMLEENKVISSHFQKPSIQVMLKKSKPLVKKSLKKSRSLKEVATKENLISIPLTEPAQSTVVIKPEYPERARIMGITGEVKLSFTVNQKGSVENIKVKKSSGYEILDRSAIKSVREVSFVPARVGDKNIISQEHITLSFELK